MNLTVLKQRLRGAKRSLTIWVNSVFGTVVLLLPVAQDAFPQLQGYLPDDVYKGLMGLVIAANIVLRFKTTADLKDKG